ncbi:hypothetical protein PACTADRAFT_47440 [Pachysolen tannophilus NRRL Y-2460]|uniref:CENP-T/Histone H4 histone fold domain-containing protein n=1 Tax=Pachysolen tannophilus NRRL Y-2460 TaxID=669874 RepID=A0A1E4U0L0_PACTA|nr:hypothetical protein PACTADRAFT_47440 [Pachysolen tannophilus NRRL Y-2460]
MDDLTSSPDSQLLLEDSGGTPGTPRTPLAAAALAAASNPASNAASSSAALAPSALSGSRENSISPFPNTPPVNNTIVMAPQNTITPRSRISTPISRGIRSGSASGSAPASASASVRSSKRQRRKRRPSTPYTLRAIAKNNETPIRNRNNNNIFNTETKRYTPRDDLKLLSRLLVKEKDDQRKGISDNESIFQQQQQQQQQQTSHDSVLSENTLDEIQRRQRLSNRLSLSNNFPSDIFTDLAIPEAIVQDSNQDNNDLHDFGDYNNNEYNDDVDMDDNNRIILGGKLNRPSDITQNNNTIENFENNYNYGDDDEDDDDDDDDINDGNDGFDNYYSDEIGNQDLSLLNADPTIINQTSNQHVRILSKLPANSNSTTDSKNNNVIPLSTLRYLSKQHLASQIDDYNNNFFKQKQFSKEMLLLLQEISDDFLTMHMDDLSSYAAHGNRKTINHKDVMLFMKRIRFLQPQSDITDLNISEPKIDFNEENDQFLKKNNQKKSLVNLNTKLFSISHKFLNLEDLIEVENYLFQDDFKKLKNTNKKLKVGIDKVEVNNNEMDEHSNSSSNDLEYEDTQEVLA